MTMRTSEHNGTAPRAVIDRVADLARHAPSMHNTQPWAWVRTDSGLDLHADLLRRLPAEDPSGRNLTISCGAALHHVQYAARALGWETAVARLPLVADETLLARVAVGRSSTPAASADDVELLGRRCTDRRRFTAWPVPADGLAALSAVARAWGAQATPVLDVRLRFRLEVLANRAVADAALDRWRAREQDAWVGRRGADGIPLTALPADPDPLRSRSRFRLGTLEDTRMAIGAGDGMIALGGETDDVGGWLRTGEALSALWLEATRAGLSVVPLSQPVEIDATRREIARDVLGGAFEPHLLVRIGWQAIGRSEIPRTPRRPLADILR